jgi:hypothetical protein
MTNAATPRLVPIVLFDGLHPMARTDTLGVITPAGTTAAIAIAVAVAAPEREGKSATTTPKLVRTSFSRPRRAKPACACKIGGARADNGHTVRHTVNPGRTIWAAGAALGRGERSVTQQRVRLLDALETKPS